MSDHICKCGKECQHYGLVGGWSKKCKACNEASAKRQRELRRINKERFCERVILSPFPLSPMLGLKPSKFPILESTVMFSNSEIVEVKMLVDYLNRRKWNDDENRDCQKWAALIHKVIKSAKEKA